MSIFRVSFNSKEWGGIWLVVIILSRDGQNLDEIIVLSDTLTPIKDRIRYVFNDINFYIQL